MNDDGVVEIDLGRRIGCGLCVTTCSTDAMRLVPKAEDKRRIPPATAYDQMIFMAGKRGMQF